MWGEGEEGVEDFLLAGAASLLEELAFVIGVEEILMALIGAGVLRDELSLAEAAQMIGGEVEREIGAGSVLGGDAVAIGLEGDACLPCSAQAGGIDCWRERVECGRSRRDEWAGVESGPCRRGRG